MCFVRALRSTSTLPNDLPAVHVDGPLIAQVIFEPHRQRQQNIQSRERIIQIGATAEGHLVRVTVDDNGPGLPAGDTERLFAKVSAWSREGQHRRGRTGTGDLSSIADAHGGYDQLLNSAGRAARISNLRCLQRKTAHDERDVPGGGR